MRLQKKTFWFILKTLCERLLRANDEIVNFRPSDCKLAKFTFEKLSSDYSCLKNAFS